MRYVITLDADTRLPRDAVAAPGRQDGAPAQPAALRCATRRVVEGYAVLQPRVTPSLPIGREGSLFQRIFSSTSGIDPYAAAVSDVYQDLFGEGSYTGKGIYDVDAFEAALDGRVPESTLLSHDLFEGRFARAGLASDIEVVEEFPSRYDVAAARQHRWARGDWQLLPWICRRGAGARAARIGRWKMIDNLRRTLSAPAASWPSSPDGRCRCTAARLDRASSLVDDRAADAGSAARGDRAAPRGHHDAQPPARAAPRICSSPCRRPRCSSRSSRTRPG